MSTGKMVAGILGGLAIGVAIGILFAPDKGSETRRKIVKRGKDSVDGIKEKLHDIADEIGQKFQTNPVEEDEA